jgi:CBS domain-containing protein
MSAPMNLYVPLKNWRDSTMKNYDSSNESLNRFHDMVMKKLFSMALNETEEILGPPPCGYSWFVMGSAGRYEQAIMSDQDHGLIYEAETEEAKEYFLKLGEEISKGLHSVGYPYCEGNVMSSNPRWCKSKKEWAVQISRWLVEGSFDSIRFLLIFYDARVLIGQKDAVSHLKMKMFEYVEENPIYLERLLENTNHIKKGVGLFQQFLTETHGSYAGSIDLKHAGFLPFVNGIRLLAIKEKILETATLSRITQLIELPEYKDPLERYRQDFQKLLYYRLKYHTKITEKYDDIHYLNVKELDKVEKKEMKQILKHGQDLQEYVASIVKGTLKK